MEWDVCVWIWKLIFEKTSGIEWENRHYFFSCNSSSYDHTANQLPSKLKLNYPNAFIENFNYIPNLSIWQGNLELLQMFGELHEYVNYKHNLQSTIFCSFSNVKTNRRTHMQQFKALYCFAKMKKIFVDFGKLYEEIHDAIQPFFRSLFDKKYMILIQLTLKHQPFFLFGIINEFGFLPGILGLNARLIKRCRIDGKHHSELDKIVKKRKIIKKNTLLGLKYFFPNDVIKMVILPFIPFYCKNLFVTDKCKYH